MAQMEAFEVERPASTPPARAWPDTVFDCANELSSCWCACWCNWLTAGRSFSSAGVTSGYMPALVAIGTSSLALLLTLLLPSLSSVWFFAATMAYVFAMMHWRGKLRDVFGIAGSAGEDFVLSWCCGCCARAQEARTVAALSDVELDFCCDEPLRAATDKHLALREDCARQEAAKGAEEEVLGTLWDHVGTLSSFSKLLLSVELSVLLLACILGGGWATCILLLALVQPGVILYLVYWRKNRLLAQADLVIKYFSVGFGLTIFAGLAIESALDLVLVILFVALFGVPHDGSANGANKPDDGDETSSGDGGPVGWEGQIGPRVLGAVLMAYVVAALVEETLKYTIVKLYPVPDDAAVAGASNYETEEARRRRDNDLNSALAVSQTALHQTHAHKATLVYFVAGALGFTLAENIGYVLGSAGPLSGVKAFDTEVETLLLRICTPVHVICAVLQAANVVQREVLKVPMPLWRLLAVPVLVHGTFDFFLFLPWPGAWGFFGMFLSACVMLGGLAWAVNRWRHVVAEVETSGAWTPLPDRLDDGGAAMF